MGSERSSVQILEGALERFQGELTVADASARSGLPLRDAEDALRTLASTRSGHLSATDKGELVYAFPQGLVRPREDRLSRRVGRAVAKFALGGVRLVVRAWVSVVLVGYALVFLGILLALTLRGGDDRDNGVGDGMATVMRVIAEALFWTFHPFSPVYIGTEPPWMHAQARRHRLPFYERVNRFVFGPPRSVPDPREQERAVVAEIRRQSGRIAPSDVVRVTGLSREQAERLLLRLVVDFQGDITVSDGGAILYSFVSLRTTSETRGGGSGSRISAPPAVWNRPAELAPLTGNSAGSNLLFALINAFNAVASGVVLANGLTIERLTAIFARVTTHNPDLAFAPLPAPDGVPLVLGAIPFAFSLALFALPLVRLARRPQEIRRVQRENGWRAVLRQVLTAEPTARRASYTPQELGRAWEAAVGRPPREDELQAAVQRLGGEVDLRPDGVLVYQFDILAREFEALLVARARATDDEAFPGEVVFSSADEGAGIREDRVARGREPSKTGGSKMGVADHPATGAPAAVTAGQGEGGRRGDGESQDPPAVRLLEEQRAPLEFLDRALADAERRRK